MMSNDIEQFDMFISHLYFFFDEMSIKLLARFIIELFIFM